MKLAVAAAVLALLVPPAFAQTSSETASETAGEGAAAEPAESTEAPQAEPVTTPFVRAHDIAMARIGQSLSHDHVATLNLLAYAATAANICPDLGIDEGQVYAALTEASHDHFEALPETDADVHKDFSLITYGVLTGLMLTEAAEDEAGFCADAVTYAQATGDEGYLIEIGEPVLYEPEDN